MKVVLGVMCGALLLGVSSLAAATPEEPVLSRCLVSIVEEARYGGGGGYDIEWVGVGIGGGV